MTKPETGRLLRPHGLYEPHATLAALAAHTVPGAATTDLATRTHTRCIRLDHNHVATIRLHFEPNGVHLTAHAKPPLSPSDFEALMVIVQQWLDLDSDLSQVTAVFSIDRRLRPLIEARPGLRIIGYADPFEGATMTVIGQHVSLAAARVFAGRLVASYRQPTTSGLYVFPTAADLAATTPASIQEHSGMTRSRASTLHALAAAVANGIPLDRAGDHDAAIRDLSSLPGIGPWTLAHIRIRSLGDHDVFPAADRVLQRALGTTDSHVAADAAEAWRPYRSYAAAHLWASVPTSSAHINQ